jgi:hypothetical protein
VSAVRYPAPIMARARQLREAGWSLAKIQQLVERETGNRPSINTVWCWVVPDAAERQATAKRGPLRARRAGAASFAYPGHRSPQWKVGRMQALHAAGLSISDVVIVMRVDFGDDLSWHEASRAVETGALPRRWREREAA